MDIELDDRLTEAEDGSLELARSDNVASAAVDDVDTWTSMVV